MGHGLMGHALNGGETCTRSVLRVAAPWGCCNAQRNANSATTSMTRCHPHSTYIHVPVPFAESKVVESAQPPLTPTETTLKPGGSRRGTAATSRARQT